VARSSRSSILAVPASRPVALPRSREPPGAGVGYSAPRVRPASRATCVSTSRHRGSAEAARGGLEQPPACAWVARPGGASVTGGLRRGTSSQERSRTASPLRSPCRSPPACHGRAVCAVFGSFIPWAIRCSVCRSLIFWLSIRSGNVAHRASEEVRMVPGDDRRSARAHSQHVGQLAVSVIWTSSRTRPSSMCSTCAKAAFTGVPVVRSVPR
jgi:hypothetical protein